MERMAETVPGSDHQELHHFLTNSPWDHQGVMDHVGRDADALLGGDADSCLVLDESSFEKKGAHSVGVARQWCGRLGKTENCQVAVFASLCKGNRHTLIDTRLYLPAEWVKDKKRSEKAGIPDSEMVLRSKSELGLAIVSHARENGIRFAWVGVDGGYGKEPKFLRALDAAGEIFVADVHKSQMVHMDDPEPHRPARKSGRGRGPSRLQAKTVAIRVDKWLAQQPTDAWQTVTLRDGDRGELRVEALTRRLWLWDGIEEKAHCWHLVVRREIGSPETVKYSLSNAPAGTPLPRLAFMQGQRFWVERSFQDGKSECGLADYQVRRWSAWHHHMAMVMIAMLFMLEERILHQEEKPLLSCNDIVYLLKNHLPRQAIDENELIEQVAMRHRQRQAVIDSNRRKQMKSLE